MTDWRSLYELGGGEVRRTGVVQHCSRAQQLDLAAMLAWRVPALLFLPAPCFSCVSELPESPSSASEAHPIMLLCWVTVLGHAVRPEEQTRGHIQIAKSENSAPPLSPPRSRQRPRCGASPLGFSPHSRT